MSRVGKISEADRDLIKSKISNTTNYDELKCAVRSTSRRSSEEILEAIKQYPFADQKAAAILLLTMTSEEQRQFVVFKPVYDQFMALSHAF